MVRTAKIPPWLAGTIGGVILILLWWILSITVFQPEPGVSYSRIPTPWQVLQQMGETGFEGYWRHFSVTLNEAGVGYLWGNGIALFLAALVLIAPWLNGVVNQIAVVTYCVPIVAIGPLALIIIGAPKSGEPSGTAIFLAALSVFFTTVVGSLLGLKAADKASLDVVTVYGGTKLTQLRKVRVIAAVPNIISALQIAVPAAFLGAVLGEYFGKVDVGVGPILRLAGVQLNSPQVWALFILCAVVALVGYGIVGLIGRLLTPWAYGKKGR